MDEPEKEHPNFRPTERRHRHDGWTPARQIAFLEALAESGCVEEACRSVGMSDTSAYKLRLHPESSSFRDAWDAAVDYGAHRLEQDAWSRSRKGVPRPIFYKGEQVGEWRHFDERLTMFLLRTRRPARFGKWTDRMETPKPFAQEESDDWFEERLNDSTPGDEESDEDDDRGTNDD